MWNIQWGSRIDFLQDLAKSGQEVPALLNRPALTIWQRYFWDAYQLLSNSRSYTSAGVAHIQMVQIQAYFQIYGIRDQELKELYLQHIVTLDNAYVGHVSKKS